LAHERRVKMHTYTDVGCEDNEDRMDVIELLGSDVGADELAGLQALLDDGASEALSLESLAWLAEVVRIGGEL